MAPAPSPLLLVSERRSGEELSESEMAACRPEGRQGQGREILE